MMGSVASKIIDTPITTLPEGYKPSANEEFMMIFSANIFAKMMAWRAELLDEANQTLLIYLPRACISRIKWIERKLR